jgi:hypothetical protein
MMSDDESEPMIAEDDDDDQVIDIMLLPTKEDVPFLFSIVLKEEET